MSKFHTSFAKIRFISAHASDFPTQFRGPMEKGWKTSRLSAAYFTGGGVSQRDGAKVVGSAKLTCERLAGHAGIETTVYSILVVYHAKYGQYRQLTPPGTK